MSRQTIPSRTVLTCDRCKSKGEQYANEGAFRNGGLHARAVEIWGRSYAGDIGGANRDIDLCASCANEFRAWLDLWTHNEITKMEKKQ